MYALTCESTVDLTKEYLNKRNIPVISYSYIIDGEERYDDMNDKTEFYAALNNGAMPTTSQICVERYKDFFRKQLLKGDLLHIAFSSGLSRSVDNAVEAIKELETEFPDRKMYVVDSTCGCAGYGLFVDTLADMRDSLNSVDELYQWALENRQNVHHNFFSTTMKYFRKSGRVSTPKALIGDLLKICPLMRTDNEGKIVAYAKAVSVGKAITKTLQEIKQHVYGGKDYGDRIWIAHSNCKSNAVSMQKVLEENFPRADVKLWDIGPVIGSHCGGGTVSVYYWGDSRR